MTNVAEPMQSCRGCSATFPHNAEADYCPRCAAENAGEAQTLDCYDRLRDHAGNAEDDAAILWLEQLVAAGERVVASWEESRLADAVNELSSVLEEVRS